MSNNSNTNLIERAYELSENNKYNFEHVKSLILAGDLDELRDFTREMENRRRNFEFQNDDYEEVV